MIATNSILVRLRSVTRRLGLNRLIGQLLSRGPYEDRFGKALNNEIRRGDVVWDVGANVGLYTEAFLGRTGPDGLVVGFEPAPGCFKQLEQRFSGVSGVKLINAALGQRDGKVAMALAPDPLAVTHRVVVDEGDASGDLESVEIRSAASVVSELPALFPNLVKVDVEGHEGAVIDGLSPLLSDRRLHCIGVEVHFGLLQQRGESDCPRHIDRTLRANGFKVRWTDASHLLATR